jgi:dipeptidyl aminopeptidase/acylaminoacyl peptidase
VGHVKAHTSLGADRRVIQLGPDDLFELQYLHDARLSPGGHLVAYAVSRTDGDKEQFEIWIAGVTGEGKQRLPYHGNAMAPRWSPDGRWIAFVGDNRLRLIAYPSLSVSEPLTPEDVSVQGAASWSPDSGRVAISLLEQHTVDGAHRIASDKYRADGLGYFDGLEQSIYELELSTRALRGLTPNGWLCSQPEWSPCGRYILFFAAGDIDRSAFYSSRLLTVDVNDGEVGEVLGTRWFMGCARWLPGGERIAVTATRDSTLTVPTLSFWVVDQSGDNAEQRAPGVCGSFGFHVQHDMPVWDLTFTNNFTVLDRQAAFATVQKGGSAEIWRIALEGDVAVDRVLIGERSCIALDASAAANVLLFTATDLRSPTELYRATLDSYKEDRLTGLNDEVLSTWPAISAERFVFESADGTEIEAWHMASANCSRPLPTVLHIHGGPFSSTGYAFRYDFQLLAAHGFGIVFANFRGSSGYGEPFVRAIMGDWGERAYPDHIGAVDAAVARGFADPDRLGVWGPSHGGFATCWIVGHTDRFEAAVAEAPLTNFETFYYLSDLPEVIVRDLGGRPHDVPDVYRSRSPITYAHRCRTPTMLLHGVDDHRCPITEAEQFYRALRDAGCKTELVRIPGCSHMGDSVGPLAARRAQNEALLRWFQEHLL